MLISCLVFLTVAQTLSAFPYQPLVKVAPAPESPCVGRATVGIYLPGLLAACMDRMYKYFMPATYFSMKDILPQSAAGTRGAGMQFMFCSAMSFCTIVSGVTRSG